MKNIRTVLSLALSACFANVHANTVKHEGHRPGRKDGGGLTLDEVREAMRKKFDERDEHVKGLIAKAEEQVKAQGKVSDDLKTQLENATKSAGEQLERLNQVEQELAALKAAGTKREEGQKSVGQSFCETEDFKALVQRGKGSAVMRLKAVTFVNSTVGGTNTGSAGDLVVVDRLPGIITPAQRKLTIRDLLMPGRTSSNSIEFVKEAGFQNMAAVVAEGASKPQSDIQFSKDTAHVRTIAHWLKASKQILADVPQLESYINARMTYGLKYAEETELLTGDGTGEHLFGLLPQATDFDDTLRAVGDTDIDTIRKAIYQCRRALYPASGIVLNPLDFMKIELQKDANDRYLWVNVTTGGTAQLWRLPVVESDAIPAGNFLVGSFNQAAQVFDREDAGVEVSTEDGDNFTKNMVTIRVEERLALCVYRPESFVYGPFVQAT